MLADMNLGKTRAEAFQAMRDRLSDDEITSIIGSILQGELLGTPWPTSFALRPTCCGSNARNGRR